MKTKSLILIFIALACGLVASIGISQVLDTGKGSGPQVEMVPILVAMQDIDIGGKLDANNVKLEEWPKSKIPEAALTSLDSLDEKYARGRLFKGEALLESKLMGPNQQDIAPKIPKGFRAVPLKIESDTVIGLIQPGDKVDVMVIVRKSEDYAFIGAKTFLKDVRVFSVGADVERTVDKDGKQVEAKVVSLLVKQAQAQSLTLAAEIGKIRLTLRRPDETDDDVDDGQTSLLELFGEPTSGSTAQAAPASPPGGILAAITTDQTTEPPPMVASVPSAITGGKFQMTVMTPSEQKRFEWQSREELPVELAPAGMSASGSSPNGFPVPDLPELDSPAADEPHRSPADSDR